MIAKLKHEPYVPESLIVHVYESGGTLVAERYDTIYWVRAKYSTVTCAAGVNCHVDSKIFCTLAQYIKQVEAIGNSLRLTLFNGATYDLDMVEGNLPTFEFPELKNMSTFDFGGVETAVSDSPLQKELNTVYVDSIGAVASSSIVGGVCNSKFKSAIPFAVPEGIFSMLNGADAQWDILDGKLYISFGAYDIVSVLSRLPDFQWWDLVRKAFAQPLEFTPIKGLRSSVSRLANFGDTVVIKGNMVMVNEEHWEPIVLTGSGEIFGIKDLMQVITDDEVGAALVGGNLFLKTDDSLFVCCSIVQE